MCVCYASKSETDREAGLTGERERNERQWWIEGHMPNVQYIFV